VTAEGRRPSVMDSDSWKTTLIMQANQCRKALLPSSRQTMLSCNSVYSASIKSNKRRQKKAVGIYMVHAQNAGKCRQWPIQTIARACTNE
jgi:hypothetical protein